MLLILYRWTDGHVGAYVKTDMPYLDCILGCSCNEKKWHYHSEEDLIRGSNPPHFFMETLSLRLETKSAKAYDLERDLWQLVSDVLVTNSDLSLEEIMIEVIDAFRKANYISEA